MGAAGRMRHPSSFTHCGGMSFGRSRQVKCVILLLFSSSFLFFYNYTGSENNLDHPISFMSWPSGMRGKKTQSKNKPESAKNGSEGKNEVKPVCQPCCYPCCSEIKPKLTAEPLTLIWTHLEYEIKPLRPSLSACAADGCTTRPCMSRLTRPVRTSAVNFPTLSRFTHSSSPLNESANHPMQPTSQTMLYVWHGKIMLGYFRCRGRLRLNQYSFIKSSTFPSELRMSGLDSHFF